MAKKAIILGLSSTGLLLLGSGAFVLYRLLTAEGGAGEAPDAPEGEGDSAKGGDCARIQDFKYAPKGCGTVTTTVYSKGNAFKATLRELPGFPGYYLQTSPQNAYDGAVRLFDAMRKAGFTVSINSAFRTQKRQIDLRKENCKPGNPTGPAVCTPLTAQAGFSNHQQGTALDLQVGGMGTPVWKWLRANAAKYGFVDDGGKYGKKGYEPWHWTYYKDRDPKYRGVA